MLIRVVHVLRLPAYGPMYIVFRLLPLMIVWVLLFWFCLAFFGFACLAACACTFTSCLLQWRLRSPCRARLQKKKKSLHALATPAASALLSVIVVAIRFSCIATFVGACGSGRIPLLSRTAYPAASCQPTALQAE